MNANLSQVVQGYEILFQITSEKGDSVLLWEFYVDVSDATIPRKEFLKFENSFIPREFLIFRHHWHNF